MESIAALSLAGLSLLTAQPAHPVCTGSFGLPVLYRGSIGPKAVRATFSFHGLRVRGEVSAGPGSTDVPMRGWQHDGVVTLHAIADRRIELRGIANADCSAIRGTWSVPGRTQPLNLAQDAESGESLAHRYYGAASDRLIDARVRAFRRAVIDGNRDAVSTLIAYPLRINRTVQSRVITRMIVSRAMLLREYDSIFTASVRSQIAGAVPADLFSRDQGIMLGGGVVWFNTKGLAFAVNQ